MSVEPLRQARDCFARRAWSDAYAGYTAAADDTALELDDLERHAIAAHLTGRNEESREILARGYREALRVGESTRAARFAFWLDHRLMFEGRMSESSGWIARARQLLADLDRECPEHGLVLVQEGVQQLAAGESEAASATFARARAIGARCGDLTVLACAGHGLGRAPSISPGTGRSWSFIRWRRRRKSGRCGAILLSR